MNTKEEEVEEVAGTNEIVQPLANVANPHTNRLEVEVTIITIVNLDPHLLLHSLRVERRDLGDPHNHNNNIHIHLTNTEQTPYPLLTNSVV